MLRLALSSLEVSEEKMQEKKQCFGAAVCNDACSCALLLPSYGKRRRRQANNQAWKKGMGKKRRRQARSNSNSDSMILILRSHESTVQTLSSLFLCL